MITGRLRLFLRGMTVRKRMMLAFALIALLPFILICVYIMQSTYTGFLNRDRDYANDYARQSYVGVNQIFLSLYETFNSFTRNSDILADVYNYTHMGKYRDSPVADQIRNAMWAGVGIDDSITMVAILTDENDVFQSGTAKIPLEQLKQISTETSSMDIQTYLLVLDDVPYLILHQEVPLRYDQQDTAIFAVGVDLYQLSEKSLTFIVGNIQEMWVVDHSGQIILHPNPKALLRQASPLDDTLVAELESGGFRLINRIYSDDNTEMKRLLSIMLVVAASILPVLLIQFAALSRSVTVPAENLLQKMEQLGHEEILLVSETYPSDTCAGQNDEIALLEKDFTAMLQRIRHLIENVYLQNIDKQKLQYKIKELELNALQQQINPHFLYNVLDNIFWRSEMSGGGDTSKMITALGNYFKASTDFKGILVTVESELQNIRSYLYLQKHMLGDRFNVEWEIDEHVMKMMTVKLILQPVVENSIVHGLADIESEGHITIQVKEVQGNIVFTIQDNGKGMEAEDLAKLQMYVDSDSDIGRSVGLRNINRRIRNYYDRKDVGLHMESAPGQGTTTRISIPMERGSKHCIS